MSRFGDTPAAAVAAWGAWFDEVMWRHAQGRCQDGSGCPVLSCSIRFRSPGGGEGMRLEMNRIRLDLYLKIDWLAGLPTYDEFFARNRLKQAIRHLLISRGLKSEIAARREAAHRLVAEDLPGDARRLFEGLWTMRHADG